MMSKADSGAEYDGGCCGNCWLAGWAAWTVVVVYGGGAGRSHHRHLQQLEGGLLQVVVHPALVLTRVLPTFRLSET